MATNDMHPEDIESAARQLLDERMDSIRTLTRVRQELVERRAALQAVEREDAEAYAAAQRNGWSEDELKRLGFAKPARSAPGRPRARRSTPRQTPAPATADDVPTA